MTPQVRLNEFGRLPDRLGVAERSIGPRRIQSYCGLSLMKGFVRQKSSHFATDISDGLVCP